MFSRALLVLFMLSIYVVSSSRTLGPSLDNSPFRIYLVEVNDAMYHYDSKKYEQLLGKVIHGRSPKDALLYCYKNVMSGFAAILTEKEAGKLKGEEGVRSVIKDKVYRSDIAPYDYDIIEADDINILC